MIVQALSPLGVPTSTARIADALWATAQAELERVAWQRGKVIDGTFRGYSLEVLDYEPSPGSREAISRNVDDLAAAHEWLSLLDPEVD